MPLNFNIYTTLNSEGERRNSPKYLIKTTPIEHTKTKNKYKCICHTSIHQSALHILWHGNDMKYKKQSDMTDEMEAHLFGIFECPSMVPRTCCFLGDHISTCRPHKYLFAFDLAILTFTLWYTYGIKYTLLAHKYMNICHILIINKSALTQKCTLFAVWVTNIN